MGQYKNLPKVQQAVSHLYAAAANPVRAEQELTQVENFIRLVSSQQAQTELRRFVDDIRKAKHNRPELERIKARLDRWYS